MCGVMFNCQETLTICEIIYSLTLYSLIKNKTIFLIFWPDLDDTIFFFFFATLKVYFFIFQTPEDVLEALLHEEKNNNQIRESFKQL